MDCGWALVGLDFASISLAVRTMSAKTSILLCMVGCVPKGKACGIVVVVVAAATANTSTGSDDGLAGSGWEDGKGNSEDQ